MIIAPQRLPRSQTSAPTTPAAAGGESGPITVAVWNVERGGRDPDGSLHRREYVLDCAAELAGAHVVVVCEANTWHDRWTDTGFATEVKAALGAHSYFVAPHDPFFVPDDARCHKMVFLGGDITGDVSMVDGSWTANVDWLATMGEPVNIGSGTIQAPGWPAINLGIVHLSPWGGGVRLAQADRLTALTDRGLWLLAGDFNCPGPRDAEPDWNAAKDKGITKEQILYHKAPDSSYKQPRIESTPTWSAKAMRLAQCWGSLWSSGRMAYRSNHSGSA